jgi:hypothetical protein
MHYVALHDISAQDRETRCTSTAKLHARVIGTQEGRDTRDIIQWKHIACRSVEPWMGTASLTHACALCCVSDSWHADGMSLT